MSDVHTCSTNLKKLNCKIKVACFNKLSGQDLILNENNIYRRSNKFEKFIIEYNVSIKPLPKTSFKNELNFDLERTFSFEIKTNFELNRIFKSLFCFWLFLFFKRYFRDSHSHPLPCCVKVKIIIRNRNRNKNCHTFNN
jgi:hypothetical protein